MSSEIPDKLEVTSSLEIPTSEFSFTFSRSSGPGGQNVNKVSTRATLRWDVAGSESLPEGVKRRFLSRQRNRITTDGELVLHSDRYRSQHRNRRDCLERLEAMLREVARPPKRRRRTRPSAASKRRRLEEKRKRSETKRRRRKPRLDE